MDARRPFRLYLSSDSSARYYDTSNTKAEFWVHLSTPIVLPGLWEVGVTELFTTTVETKVDSALFLYTNIIVQVPVSDSMSRCLRVIPPLSDVEPNSFLYERPYFERVEFPEIQDIKFRLLDNKGTPYNLSRAGVVTHIVLWFRPVM